MKVNVNETIKQLNGQPLLDAVNGEAVEVTFRVVIVNALQAPVQGEDGMAKMKKWDLVTKIYKNDEVDLDEKEIALIKEAVGKKMPVAVVGPVYELLKV